MKNNFGLAISLLDSRENTVAARRGVLYIHKGEEPDRLVAPRTRGQNDGEVEGCVQVRFGCVSSRPRIRSGRMAHTGPEKFLNPSMQLQHWYSTHVCVGGCVNITTWNGVFFAKFGVPAPS